MTEQLMKALAKGEGDISIMSPDVMPPKFNA